MSTSACYTRPFFDNTRGQETGATNGGASAPSDLTPSTDTGFGQPSLPPPPNAEAPRPPAQIGGVYRGNDTFTARPSSPPPRSGVLRTPQGEVTLNFVDADLREVVKAILGDTLGANYIMDPQVQGTVTLQTSDPVPGPALISVLESILAVNNAVLRQAEGVYQVVPADQAIRASGGLRSSLGPASQAPGAQMVVVPLRHVSAAEVEKILAPFAPPGGVLRVDPRRNLVVVGGSRSEVAGMMDIIETFDVDWLAGMSFALLPIRSTTSKTMVEELEKVFGDPAEGPLAGVVRFVPIERLNAVLVISSRSTYIDRARSWVARLDVGEDETPRLYVYYCENSRAEDLATVLSQVFGQQATTGGTRPPAELAPGLSPVTLGGQGQQADTTFGGGGAATAPGAPGRGPTLLPGGAGGGGAGGGDGGVQVGSGSTSVRIIADKVKNALVVLAKPSDYRTVESALQRLDIVPLQVLLEATILEVTLNDTLRYGVEWFFKFGGSSKVGFSSDTATGLTTPVAGVVNSVFPGFSYLVSPTRDSVRAVVNALDAVSDINVISSPQLFVLDNQTASLTVGDEVPIQTQSQQSIVTGNAPIVSSIQYKETGVILNVTPRVNAGGLVTMEISQEVTDVVPAAPGVTTTDVETQTPTFNSRKVETTVAVQGGETVALGGLITDSRTNTASGLPYLSRLPFIGWLFGTKSDVATRTELLVLITPRVVGGVEQARQVTQELRSRLRTIAPLEQRIQ